MTAPRGGSAVGRTDLSWQRTGLGVLGVAGLIGHRAVVHDRAALLVVAGVAALLGLCLLGGLAPARSRQLLRRRAVGAEVTAPLLVAAATGVVVLVALAAAVAVVTL